MAQNRRKLVACYDYGTGGVWEPVWANSVTELQDKYPELVVFETPADWMTPEFWEEVLAKRPVPDVDNEPTGVLKLAVLSRGRDDPDALRDLSLR